MFSFRTTPLAQQQDRILQSGRLAVFCTQTAWNPQNGRYVYESLSLGANLRRVFFVGDGVVSGTPGLEEVEFVKLDPSDPYSLSVEKFRDIDALIVEFQDLGSRYDVVTSMLFSLFQLFHHEGMDISVFILDRENPTGRGVEGTMLYPDFVTANYENEPPGTEGLPHRHGLTLGEVANLIHSDIDATFPLHVISYRVRSAAQLLMPWSISPEPDYTGLFSSMFYSGMMVLEWAGLSVARGTGRAFEMFGVPSLCRVLSDAKYGTVWNSPDSPVSDPGVFVRPTSFVPERGPFAGLDCYGFHLIPNPGNQYHSLAHTLRILRFVYGLELCDAVRTEMALGDSFLFQYVTGDLSWTEVKEHLKIEEQKWIRKAKKYMLYDEPLTRIKTPGKE